HAEWECKYHVVFIPKGRRKTPFGLVRQHLGEVFYKLYQPSRSLTDCGPASFRYRARHDQTERLRGLEIDHRGKLGWGLHRQVADLGTAQLAALEDKIVQRAAAHQPGMAGPLPGTSDRRPAHHSPDPEMAQGGCPGRRGCDGERGVNGQGSV